MINIPKQDIKPAVASTLPTNFIRIHSLANESKEVKAMERRLSLPTRRKYKQSKQSKQQIERRVSSDRRRSVFSAKV